MNDFCLLLYHFTIVLIILVIIIVVTIWKRKLKRRMLLIKQIQFHDYDEKLPPEDMNNNDMKGKLELLQQLPHNENSYDDPRSLQGQTPSALPMQSSTMPLDPFTVKDKEDTTSMQSKRSDGDYVPLNATNPFYKMDGEIPNENGEDEGGNQ